MKKSPQPERFRGLRLLAVLLGLAVLPACSGVAPEHRANVVRGKVDLSASIQAAPSSVLQLDGQWQFLPGQFALSARGRVRPRLVTVPRTWQGELAGGSASGAGTYLVTLRLHQAGRGRAGGYALYLTSQNSAFRVFCNGEEIALVGSPELTPEKYVPAIRTMVRRLPHSADGVYRVAVQVANYSHVSGGMTKSISVGTEDAVARRRALQIFADLFLFGSLLIMSLYHVGLFLNRREDLPSLAFSSFCLVICLRVLVTSEFFIADIWPDLSYDWIIRLGYLTMALAAPTGLTFFALLFSERTRRVAILVAWLIHAPTIALILLTTPLFFTGLLTYFQIPVLLCVAYTIFVIARAIVIRKPGATVAGVGLLFIVIGTINDILRTRDLVQTPELIALGVFCFVLAQSVLLSRLFARAFRAVTSLSERLHRTNAAYTRFVPREFLEQLDKADITEIRLGDQVQRDMAVLFCDIRSFTELSETMSPQDNFNFLNSYLKRVTPIVRENGGFIDKYIGDSIMALFPQGPLSAMRTALAMQHAMGEYNRHREHHGYSPIRISIGIHSGRLMLGTIGGEERMEGTVISDTVNLASRLEKLTRSFGASIVISDEALFAARAQSQGEDLAVPPARALGRVRVRGRRAALDVFQVLPDVEGNAPVAELYVRTRPDFESGVELWRRGRFAEALQSFERVLAVHPGDTAADAYLRRGVPGRRAG